jgi:hypothetical protein
MAYKVEISNVAAQLALVATQRATLETIGQSIGDGFGRMMGFMELHDVRPSGPPFVAYPVPIAPGAEGTVQVCMPIKWPLSPPTGLEVIEFAGGPVVRTHHLGPYREIGAAYEAMTKWMEEHGQTPAGPPRETYLNEPEKVPEAELLTRIDWPVSGTQEREAPAAEESSQI